MSESQLQQYLRALPPSTLIDRLAEAQSELRQQKSRGMDTDAFHDAERAVLAYQIELYRREAVEVGA